MSQKKKIVVCGAGNASHVFFVLASTIKTNDVYLLSTFKEEALRFKNEIMSNNNTINVNFVLQKEVVSSKVNINNITNDAEYALTNADIIIIALPAFAHNSYLKSIKKYTKYNKNKNTKPFIALFPGASGLECEYSDIFGNNNTNFILMSCITLPWAARIESYGKSVEILGIKEQVEVCFRIGYKTTTFKDNNILNNLDNTIKHIEKYNYMDIIHNIIHHTYSNNKPKLVDYGHLFNMSLGAPNAVAHPAIMYEKWHKFDGKPIEKKPLFYHGLTEAQANLMVEVNKECVNIANEITKQTGIKLHIDRIYDWYYKTYGKICKDTTSLHKMIITNPSYPGLTHPCIQTKDAKYLPNYKSRYLTEDIPYGLIVIRGIAYIVDKNIKCNNIDKIIIWSQKVLDKEYLKYNKNGKLLKNNISGKDIAKTRAPQRYGQTSVFQIV